MSHASASSRAARRLVVATANTGKLREFKTALAEAGLEVCGLEALSDASPVHETGSTFEENACQKAVAYSQRTSLPVLADDSGLEVDALAGEPGVRSARWGGPGLDDEGRNLALLAALEGVAAPRRTARFRCVLALARTGSVIATFEGSAEGRIVSGEPRGEGGFGYDPVFENAFGGRTFAEINSAEKGRVSHRGAAIARLLEALRAEDPRMTELG